MTEKFLMSFYGDPIVLIGFPILGTVMFMMIQRLKTSTGIKKTYQPSTVYATLTYDISSVLPVPDTVKKT